MRRGEERGSERARLETKKGEGERDCGVEVHLAGRPLRRLQQDGFREQRVG